MPANEVHTVTGDQTATYMDHYYLNFWLWACLHDGEKYLAAASAFRAMIAGLRTTRESVLTFNQTRLTAQREMELAKYHFVTAVGSLVRNLEHSKRLFPSIEAACEKVQHLFAEGKLLRDMIEHADEYNQGKGREQAGFVRDAPFDFSRCICAIRSFRCRTLNHRMAFFYSGIWDYQSQ